MTISNSALEKSVEDVPRKGMSDVTLKIVAFLGSTALGFTALINAVIAGLALFTGNLIGAVGDVASKNDAAKLADDAGHAAAVAKGIAIGFFVLAAIEFAGSLFLTARKRNVIVPIACGLTVAGEVGLSVWSGKFNALDAILIGCALFATWVWWQLPRAGSPEDRSSFEPARSSW
jgi:hypothetical protein